MFPLGTVGMNGLSAIYKSHTILSSRSSQQASFMYGLEEQWHRCFSSWYVSDLKDGRRVARAGGTASKVQKYATAPVKRSGIAEGPCGQRQSFSSSFDLFFFDSLVMVYWHLH